MNLSALGDFKVKAISKLISDENILDVLLGKYDQENDDVDALLFGVDGVGGCVHQFEYVPDTQEDAMTFLDVEVVPAKQSGGDASIEMYLYVFAYCSKKIMQTYKRDGANGTRIDILMNDIDKNLNGSDEFGIGRLQWYDGSIYKPANAYYGRMSVYTVSAFNRKR